MKKKWWKSKTIWFNVVSAVVAGGMSVQGNLDGQAAQIVAGVVTLGNFLLRFMTKEGVGK